MDGQRAVNRGNDPEAGRRLNEKPRPREAKLATGAKANNESFPRIYEAVKRID
jgi:hypothetical protein